MTKLEELKIKMEKAFKDYKQISITKNQQYDMIIGCLNRISVSNDENEVERYYNDLLNHSIKEYKEIARKTHQKWVVYDNIFNEYCEEKNKNENRRTSIRRF